MHTTVRARRSSERGTVVIQVAVCLLGLLAFTAFVVDYGVMWASRGQAQTAADAGALAGIVSGSGPTCAFLCASASSAIDVGVELSGAGVCRTVRAASGPVHGARVVPMPSTHG